MIHHINKLKNKDHMIFSVDAEKASEKNATPFKFMQKLNATPVKFLTGG